jgi:hypothetical protein
MNVKLEHEIQSYAQYLDEILPTISADEVTAPRVWLHSGPQGRRLRPSLVAAGAAIVVFILVGAAGMLALIGTSNDVTSEPIPSPTTTIEDTAPIALPPSRAEAYDLKVALRQVEQFHQVWNEGITPRILSQLQPDSMYRRDSNLIEIAVNGFHAQVEGQCTAAPGADGDRANVSCHVLVEDDFYSPAQIWLQSGIVYEVTVDGIDILDGEPIWAIEPTGTALAFLEDFDAELAGPLAEMMDPFGWIWLDPSAGTPNWGDGPPLRSYSVETVEDAFVAVQGAWEFLEKDGDLWEPIPASVKPVVPAPQSQPRACPMPLPISDFAFEVWYVDLHDAIGVLVQDTNDLGAVLVETDDFNPGWQHREPVAPTLAPFLNDLNIVESMTTAVLQEQFGATYNEETGWMPIIPHIEEISYGLMHYRSNVLPAFFEMRTPGTAIAYFNTGGATSGPCGTMASLVLSLDTITESGQYRTP